MRKQRFLWKELTMGVCYYPEHWKKEQWESDLQRMLDAGITVIRIGEFSWNKTEPREGIFTFSFFDTFLELCLKMGMKVIFGTPTATPPAWLTVKYPEVLNATQEGMLYRHGGRRHYNYNSIVYQEFCSRIVRVLGKHYGSHPAIIGWQIDNELNCEVSEFYSDADQEAFRKYLEKKYQTLDALNEAWGTDFWNQTYTDWQEITLPGRILNEGNNPHMHLDYYRFVSDSTLRFCRMQAEILREYVKPGDFITTNGMFWNMDNHRMEEESLDVYTYDCYPNFAYGLDQDLTDPNSLRDRRWTKNLHEVRSICPHFGIMEQQSGANGWTTKMEAPTPRPGQLRLWTFQSIAQGADYISFFRWRTCTFGTEMYWHGILDYDGRDNRKLSEVKEVGEQMRLLSDMAGAEYLASFGLLQDYDNRWDTNVDAWHRRIQRFSEEEIFAASELCHTPYDVVDLKDTTRAEALYPYPVLIYPHPMIMNERRREILQDYVEHGGILILGCRSGLKDMRGHMVSLPQPGLLASLTGTDVREFTFVSNADGNPEAVFEERILETPVYNDVLTPLEGTAVLAGYRKGFYADEAVLTEKQLGKGRVLHLGCAFSREIVQLLLKRTGVIRPFDKWVTADESVELVLRKKDGKNWLFALNFSDHASEIDLKEPLFEVFSGKEMQEKQELPAYGVAVFTWKDR